MFSCGVRRSVLACLITAATISLIALLIGTRSVHAINAHPRIWLTSQMLSDLAAKQASGDRDWLATKAAADQFLTQTIPRVTITSASNTNPVQFTTSGSLPWVGNSGPVYLAGAAGAWAAVNNRPPAGGWAGTLTGTNTFTIPVDASAFGSFSGQTLTFFMAGGESAANYLSYAASGSGWKDAFLQLGLVYKVTGNTAYAAKALALLDWINTLGAAGMTAPVSQDSGRGSLGATLGVAIGFDWFYDLLSPAQKAATSTTLNVWNTWTSTSAYAVNDPTSNYWANHVTGAAATGYATLGDNPNAQAWIDWATNNWTANFAPKFFNPPSTINKAAQDGSGFYYSGQAVTGFNYGGNDISRHLKYMLMVRTATGVDMFSTTDYAQRWARNLIYNLKPDRWRTPNFGQWTGAWYGIMTYSEALLLSATLEGTPEGQWAQWMYLNQGPRPSGADTAADPDPQDRLMFAKTTRPATDYRTSQPPYFFSDGGEANVYWRSNWSDTSDYVLFNVSGAHYSGSTPKYCAHVDLTRGSDYLLVQSNFWKGTGDGINGAPELAETHGAFANTLYFWDGGDNAGGRCFSQEGTYNGCQLGFGIYKAPIQKLAPDYAFAQNDFATAYDYYQIPSARTLKYFFRSFVALGDGTYVVWDRIRSTSASHVKQIRWHLSSASTPVRAGNVISSVVGSSKIFVNTLLPAAAQINLTRNVDSSNRPANWRAEVTDGTPLGDYTGLTVFHTTSSTGALPATTRLTSIDTNFEGVQVADVTPKIAILPKGTTANGDGSFQSTTYSAVAFTTTHGGDGKYLVAGLASGTYTVARNGSALSGLSAVPVDSTGVLYFTAPAGAFAISRVGAPPPPPPPPSTATLSALLCTPSTFASGSSTACIITLSESAPAAGAAISLSDNNASLTVPSAITIAGGSTSASFSATSASVTSSQTASITATYSGISQVTSVTMQASTTPTGSPPGTGTSVCSGGQFVMNADILLSGSDTVDLIGTPETHCSVVGNNHRFLVTDASWTGHFRMQFVDAVGLGSVTSDILGGPNPGDYGYIAGNGYIDIQDSTFDRSGGFNLMTGGSSSIRFNRNVYKATNLVRVDSNASFARPWFKESGTSNAPKYFQGNRIHLSWMDFGSPNWTIGAASGCTSTCDADGNILIGKRVGMWIRGTGTYASYNYSHSDLDVTPDWPVWSQVYNLANLASGSIVEHNIFRTGHWIANGIDGELRNNVLTESSPHNFVRLGSGGLVHHNILLALYPGTSRYTWNYRLATGDSAFGLLQTGNSLSIYNNTLDARGAAVKAVVWAIDGATINSFRNNVTYRLGLMANGCPSGADCTSALGPDQQGFVTPPPSRALYLDYNAFFYDPTSQRRVTYDLGALSSPCQPGWGGHDLGTCPDGSVDPQFRGPLPIASGKNGQPSVNDSGFPFNDSDILSGVYSVSNLLSYFRWIYAPAAGSPLIGAQDPRDGSGDIGAVQTSTLPGSAPAIVTTNKKPMVHPGPSFSVSDGTAFLSGYAADDGLPSNNLTLQWTRIAGPGSVSFSNAAAGFTIATFPANGDYSLRLTASDGVLTSAADVQITVGGADPTAAAPPRPPSDVRIMR